ncbi:MAG TPA: hypothetical protein VIY53_03150 [Acidobacteriaceae bacterium]
MNFVDLHERLRLETWRRIDLGVLSSTLLASKSHLAQAHISNFLHRRRRLSLNALDRILMAQDLRVEDLTISRDSDFPSPEGNPRHAMDIVPIVSQSVAMTAPAIRAKAAVDSIQLPSGWLAALPARRAVGRRSWERFVAIRVTGAQALSMDPLLRRGSLAVLDRHYNAMQPLRPPHPNIYAVRVGSQLLLRHVSVESGCLVLRPRSLEYPVELVELAAHESPAGFLVGRVCLSIAEV